jgi:hypothetical protein
VHWSPAVVTRVPTAPSTCSFQTEGCSREQPFSFSIETSVVFGRLGSQDAGSPRYLPSYEQWRLPSAPAVHQCDVGLQH